MVERSVAHANSFRCQLEKASHRVGRKPPAERLCRPDCPIQNNAAHRGKVCHLQRLDQLHATRTTEVMSHSGGDFMDRAAPGYPCLLLDLCQESRRYKTWANSFSLHGQKCQRQRSRRSPFSTPFLPATQQTAPRLHSASELAGLGSEGNGRRAACERNPLHGSGLRWPCD